jgi:hypothetical protein
VPAVQWDDEANDRQMALDLFDAFGSGEKTSHATRVGTPASRSSLGRMRPGSPPDTSGEARPGGGPAVEPACSVPGIRCGVRRASDACDALGMTGWGFSFRFRLST